MLFKTRTLRTWAVLISAFAILLLVLLLVFAVAVPGVLGALLSFGIAAAVTGILFTMYDGRPIRLRCPKCRKMILSNTPWVCGSCGKKNVNVELHPFLSTCEHCGIAPKAYLCHHKKDGEPCNKVIFLTVDESEHNMARCLNTKVGPDEEEAGAEREQLRVKRSKEHEVVMAELDLKLAGFKAQIEGPKIKSHRERIIAAFDDKYDGSMAVKEHLAKRMEEIKVQFKNHPAQFKLAKQALEDAARESLH